MTTTRAARWAAFWRPLVPSVAVMMFATVVFASTVTTVAVADPAADPTDVALTTGGDSGSGVVPDGVCALDASVIGGGGGANFAYGSLGDPNATDHRGGDAVSVTASYRVHPGQPWTASVGGGGGGGGVLTGGVGVNGSGGTGADASFHEGSGGGGRSDFAIGDTSSFAIIAGGGGGTGGGHFANGMEGGDAGVPTTPGVIAPGQTGENGNDEDSATSTTGGQGGQATGPGAGGINPTTAVSNGSPGLASDGGDGGTAGTGGSIDLGGGGGAGVFGGGGGAGTRTNGANGTNTGASTSEGGSGGGGGSSVFTAAPVDGLATPPTVLAAAVTVDGPGRSGWGGTGNASTASGTDGLVDLDFVPCNYDLTVTKTVSPAAVLIGETMTWTVTVTNAGPDPMTRGDLVTIADTPPGAGPTSITSITHTAGSNSGLDQSALTCDTSVGAAWLGPVTCSQPYGSAAGTNVPSGGLRGLDVGGSIEIIYTQVAAAADLGCLTNTVSVTDRVDNGSDDAEVCVSEEVDYLELSKTLASGPTNNQDGTYSLAYDLVVTNPTSSPTCTGTGLAPDYCVLAEQTNVQITDGLDATIAAAATAISHSLTAGTCTPAAAYDGVVNTNLLSGTDALPAGTSCTVQVALTVTADPDAGIGTVAVNTDYTNSAAASSAEGATATDSATTQFPETPSMTVGKMITAGPTSNQDGTYALTYEVTALNDGDVELRDLQLTDGLFTVFGSALVSATSSSTGCTDNTAGYDGITVTDILEGTDVLGVGLTCTATIDVVITVDSAVPGSALLNTDYTNTANGSATSPSDAPVAGSDVETVQFTDAPDIGTTKSVVAGPVNNQDGTYSVTYEVVVENLGDVELRDVQATDGLYAVWGDGLVAASASIVGPCTGNPAPYDGITATDLLSGTDSLPVGASCTVAISATLSTDSTGTGPATPNTDYTNVANVSGTSPGGTDAGATSQATTQLVEAPSMTVEKALTAGPANNGDGTYDLEYTVTTTNTGDVEIRNLQVTDGLLAVWGGALVSGTAAVTTPLTCTDSGAPYDGTVNTDLLAGVDTLGVGAVCTIVVSAVVSADSAGAAPAALNTDYTNTANGAGSAPSGAPVGATGQAVAQLTESPGATVDKAVTAGPINNGDGTYTIEYTIDAANTGDVELRNYQVDDGLLAVWGSGLVTASAVSTAPCTDSTAPYDGVSNTNLLVGTDTLAPGATCSIVITAVVTVDGNIPGSALIGVDYTNTASGDGDTPAGTNVIDTGAATTQVSEAPSIAMTKNVIAGPTNNQDGSWSITYQIDVANTGDAELRDVQVDDGLQTVFGAGLQGATASTTGACTDSTAPYDGVVNTDLLTGTDIVPGAGTCVITINAVVEVNSNDPTMAQLDTDYVNVAAANGDSPSGINVSDSGTATARFEENPGITLTKAVTAGPSNNMDSTYTQTWTLTVANDGDTEVRDVQVSDNLATTFASAAAWTLDGHSIVSGPCTTSAGFDGIVDTDVLTGTDILPIGDQCEIDITVTVTPGATLGVYTNGATADGVSPAGTALSDAAGADTTYVETPLVNIEKSIVSGPSNDGTGIFTTVYSLGIQNTGDVPLSNVQVDDDLATVYAGAESWSASSTVIGGACTDNATPFDGDSNQNTLSGADTLTAGSGCTIEVVVVFNPGTALGDYVNFAHVAGTSPGGAIAEDTDDSTGVAVENPAIALAKDITAGPVNNGDGTYSLTYTLVVSNVGDVPLNIVQVDDDLAATYAAATSWMLDSLSVTDGPCTAATGVAPYDGDTNIGTLEGVDMLIVGGSCTIEIDITVTPGATLGAYNNTATASGISRGGESVEDISQDGADPDIEGDGPGDNSDPTPVWFNEEPQLSLTKDIAAGLVNNGDGTYTLTYVTTVANSGDVVLRDVQVNDDLAATFAAAAGFDVTAGSVVVTAGPCTGSTTYDGAAFVGLLSGTDALSIAETCSIEFEVTVSPGSVLGAYDNTSSAAGTSPAGDPVTDESQDGTDADPDGDNDPTNNSDPTTVSFAENPELALSKAVVPNGDGDLGPINNQDGSYSLSYGVVATNTGDIVLHDVQITDDLSATFADATTWTVDGTVVESGGCTLANPAAFDGSTNVDLLEGADSLAIGDSCTVRIDVTVVPGSDLGPYENTATAMGTSPTGADVGDISQDGAAADANGDGDASDDSDPTPVIFPEAPEISLRKALVSGPQNRGDGVYDLTYDLVVINTGDTPLVGVQVNDDLSVTYADAGSWSVVAVSVIAGDCIASDTYDGGPAVAMLAGTDSLSVDASCTVAVDVVVVPGADLGPYENTAVADATSAGGASLTDTSQDGAAADPDGDGDPSNNGDPTPAWFTEEPGIALTKRLSEGPISNGDGTYELAYTMVVSNVGNVPVTRVQVNDTLSAAFADATEFAVSDLTVAAGPCTKSTAYDGVADTAMLTGTDELTIGQTCTLVVSVVVTPGDELGPYENSATVQAVSVAGAAVSDVSQDGTDEDPDGDNDPGNNSEPTPAAFPVDPVIGLSKKVHTGPTVISGSNYSLTYRLVVANEGDTALKDTQIEDDLATTFATARAWTLVGTTVANGDCTAATSYDGDAQADLLTGDDTLAIGASCTIDIEVTVDVGTSDRSFENTATAVAAAPNGDTVTDTSQDGVDNDPDNDGDPSNDSVPTRVLVSGVTPPAPTPTPVPFTPAPTPLAVTGAGSLRLALLALFITAAGFGLFVGARRRSNAPA